MSFEDLLRIVGDEPVFDTGFLAADASRTNGLAGQLDRWRRAGKILQLRRGLYALAPPYQKTFPHPFIVANRLSPGSYVSGVAALAHYGAIPEAVFEVTSCGPGRPGRRTTPLGRFSYRFLKPALRTGYRLLELTRGQRAFVATPEKAFLDLAWFHPDGDDPGWIDALRLDLEAFSSVDLTRGAAASGSPKLMRAAEILGAQVDDPELGYETL